MAFRSGKAGRGAAGCVQGRRVPAGPGAGVPRSSQSPEGPPLSEPAGRRGAAGPADRTKDSEPAGRGGAPRDPRGHSPSSSTFFPAGSLERERVETSLRMQDLTGEDRDAR